MDPVQRSAGRWLLWLGLGLTLLGLAAYFVQISMQRLTTPWYVPGLALLGLVCVVASLWQRRTIWRFLGLILVVLLGAAEVASLLAARLPAYTGPVEQGKPFPTFSTQRADGTPFTQRDLAGSQNNVLVFFRGRW
jgi:hypothetical protein